MSDETAASGGSVPAAGAAPAAAPAPADAGGAATVDAPAPAQTQTAASPAPAAQSSLIGDKAAPPAQIAPDAYGDFGLQEGTYDANTLNGFRGLLASAGMPPEVGAAFGGQLLALQQEHMARNQAEVSQQWLSEAKADPEFGGAKLEQTQTYIATAIDTFAGSDAPALRALFNETGLGNNPLLVRFFARAGRVLSEDGPVNSGFASRQTQDTASLLYPSMKGN